jgi:hypothetical protein
MPVCMYVYFELVVCQFKVYWKHRVNCELEPS